MLYGIVYVYRLSDFIEVARAHGIMRICLTSCWLKEDSPASASCDFQWTDIHEVGFMGAFGMCYKMLVTGLTMVNSVADNHSLWSRAKQVETELLNVWNTNKKTGSHRLLIIPGVIVQQEVVRHALIPWELFMSNRIPETVPVCDNTSNEPERS